MKGRLNMRWRRLVGTTLALGSVACGSTNQPGNSATAGTQAANESGGSSSTIAADTGSDPPPSAFVCSDLGPLPTDAASRVCYDFSTSSDAAAFTPDGGNWAIRDGGYAGTGPSTDVTCVGAGSLFTASTLSNFSAADVRVHVKMTSLNRPDKVLVLRARDSGNRIELNFRANYVYDGQASGGDLTIAELVGCQDTTYLDTGVVLIPHAMLQTLTVDVELRGQHFQVTVDGTVVYNNTLPVATTAGSAGFSVIYDAVELYDDFVVETLN